MIANYACDILTVIKDKAKVIETLLLDTLTCKSQ